jgi:CRP-like cAMP-binding protein
MSIVIDTLHNSAITQELTNTEVKILAELFDTEEYKSGEAIVPHGTKQDNLYILAEGEIEVKIQSVNGESTIHVLKPGDLAGIITFVGGTASQHSASLYALGTPKVLCLERAKFETLIESNPMIVYKVMRGVVRNVHSIVRHMNAQSSEMSNYIFRTHGRY